MNISRRNLLVRGGGAVTAALLARPGILHAGSDEVAAKAEPQRGKVKIREVQSASSADEYVCNLIKITTDSGLSGIGEARCKIPVQKQVKRQLNRRSGSSVRKERGRAVSRR